RLSGLQVKPQDFSLQCRISCGRRKRRELLLSFWASALDPPIFSNSEEHAHAPAPPRTCHEASSFERRIAESTGSTKSIMLSPGRASSIFPSSLGKRIPSL